MTCYLRRVGDWWHVAFTVGGRGYAATLRTKSEKEAERRVGPIREAVYRIESGALDVPPGADVRAFVLAGGRAGPGLADLAATIDELVAAYPAARADVEANSRVTIAIHLRHFARILGGGTRLASLTIADMERYAAARLAEDRRGSATRPYTVRKELRTMRAALAWAPGRLAAPPPTWEVKAVPLPKDRLPPPFRTHGQIIAAIGPDAPDDHPAWRSLYLAGPELAELLAHVRSVGAEPWVYPMAAFTALTGARRSEMLRSRAEDWDMAARVVRVREKKRSRGVEETFREVDLHPVLAGAWSEWAAVRPRSPWAFTADGGRLGPDQASDALRAALRSHPKWSKVRGFHAFRHSVASILASEGVDQRYIDRILGHQTEEMRRRYRHLFPRGASRAIAALLPAGTATAAGGGPTGAAGRGCDSAPGPPG